MKFFRHVINNYRPFKSCMSAALFVGCVNAFANQTSSQESRVLEVKETPTKMKSGLNEAISEGLLLYYHQYSYYSQKVVMALYEKNLPFQSKIINLFKDEQYEPWFLALNARGEIPVLQDTGKIIPDSARIIDFLEDNFSNGDTPRLIPMDQGAEVRQNVNNFRRLIAQAPGNLLVTGALLNSHIIKNPRAPFIGPIRSALARAERDGAKKLREYAVKYPEYTQQFLQKAQKKEDNYKTMSAESNFLNLLHEVDQILDKCEKELSQHTGEKENWWLCSSTFSIADVELTILLERLHQLGLDYLLWSSNKRPGIEKYYERVRKRNSYKKTIPGTMFLLKTILISQAPLLVSVVTAVAIIAGGVFVFKRYLF